MSIIKTRLQDIRVAYPNNLDRDELRATKNGLLNAVLEQTDSAGSVVAGDLKAKILGSEGRNIDVPVIKKGNIQIKNVRSCDVQGGRLSTDLVRVTFKTMVADIMMIPREYDTNQISYYDSLNEQLRVLAETFKREIEADLETTLDAKKTTVYNSSIVDSDYSLTGGAIRVERAKEDFFMNNLEAINFADDFYDPTIKVIANHNLMPVVSRYVNQGSANSTNTAFQFAGKDFRFTNAIPNESGVLATGYFMPNGTVGLLTRVDGDAMRGSQATDGTIWDMDMIPELPFPVGIKFNSKCDDKSLIEATGFGHLTATLVEHWQISFDFAIVTPYHSATDVPTAIRKFEIVPTVVVTP